MDGLKRVEALGKWGVGGWGGSLGVCGGAAVGEKGLGGAEVQNIVLQTVAEWRNAKILLCMLRKLLSLQQQFL